MNILIIDKQDTRLKAMVKVMVTLGGHAIYSYMDSPATRDNKMYFMQWDNEFGEWNKVEPPSDITLFLIHGRDYRYQDVIQNFGKRIWYGGVSGRDPQAPEGEDSIMRVIEVDDGILTPAEAKELLNYASGNTTDRPRILTNASFDERVEFVGSILRTLRDMKTDALVENKEIIKSHLVQLNLKTDKMLVEENIDQIITFREEIDTAYNVTYMQKLRGLRDYLMETP